VFYGEFSHTLDKKGRLIIPSRFRETIRENGIEKLYVTRGLDECLFIFSESEWKLQENRFREMSFTKKEVRKFRRLFFSGAIDAVPDKQWRILIPDYLREYAQIKRDIMIIGVSSRIEVWSRDKWQKFYDSTKESYEDIAEKLVETE